MKDTPTHHLSFDEFDELKNPRPAVQEFDRVVARAMSRRGFLGVLAMGSAAAAMGSLPGAVIGGLLVGVVTTLLQTFLPPDLRPFREAFLFALVILALLVRPNGLFPARGLKERI